MGSVYAAILNVDDDIDNDLLPDLPELRNKNKKCLCCQVRKLKCLHKQLTEERKDLSEKLALKSLCSTISANSR